jgi:serine/threonine protein kinase
LYQLTLALKYLHIRGMMHRDLKLENVMLRGDGRFNVVPVLIDFGLVEKEGEK